MSMSIDLPEVVGAIGALGLASFALVDTSKIAAKGGVSNSGFAFVQRAVRQVLPGEARSEDSAKSSAARTVLDILHANWIGGMALGDQKAVAKSLIKLRLTEDTAEQFARAAGVNADKLKSVAAKMASGDDLVAAEANVLGRFDLALTAMLDEGYQRADQKYRNVARAWAMVVAVVIALLGGWVVAGGGSVSAYFHGKDIWIAFLCGLLATPLAPIAKDLASALQAGVKVAQSLRK
jgi:hypothetical protein